MKLMKYPPSPQMIYKLRMRWGLSQEAAGKLIGASRQGWQKWETGERNMPRPIQYLLWCMERRPSVKNTVANFHSKHVSFEPDHPGTSHASQQTNEKPASD